MKEENLKYYMGIAKTVAKDRCLKRNVGAILVRDNRILATGYNGTPSGTPNCTEDDQGCERCAKSLQIPGEDYGSCVCIHAEMNALLTAARFGISIQGSTLFTTLKPCLGCLKAIAQVKVKGVYFAEFWDQAKEGMAGYRSLETTLPDGIRQVIT